MCEKRLGLRVFVSERLAAAAEEIFALVERVIVEYEEELCRSKEENQRKQQLLDSLLMPQIRLHRTEQDLKKKCKSPMKASSPSPDVLEETGQAQGLDRLADVQVKSEEPDQGQTSEPNHVLSSPGENRTDQNPENAYEDPKRYHNHFHFIDHPQHNGYSTDNSDEWGESLAKRVKAEGEEEEDESHDVDRSYDATADKLRDHQCLICGKVFSGRSLLKRHSVVHTGEKPFSCPVCHKGFTQNAHLKVHMCTHTGIMPYRCSACGRGFTRRDLYLKHEATHLQRSLNNTGIQRDVSLDNGRTRRNCLNSDGTRRGAFFSNDATHFQFQKLPERTVHGECSSQSLESNRLSLFSCSLCQKGFLSKNDIENHMTIHRK